MGLSEYRRFVSYIYAYNQGKKDRNVGFAKVEVREGILKVNIQLGGLRKESEGLDVYGFVRKEEKLYGIWLGEMTMGAQALFHYEGDPKDLQESGYSLNELSGLWVKGNRGENYITVWDDDPIESMELEVEVRILVEPEEIIQDEETVAESEEVMQAEETVAEPEEIMQDKETVAEPEEIMQDKETAAEPEESVPTEDVVQVVETEMIKEELMDMVPGIEAASAKVLNGVRARENEEFFMSANVDNVPKKDEDCGYAKKMEALSASCPKRFPFAEGEVKECIQITPRELSMFQDKGWNARKNSFVLQGYYQFRHLLFGCLADGTYFLGVPGFFHPRERQRAMLFGCPVFKESRERHWKGRFGYWCRPLE